MTPSIKKKEAISTKREPVLLAWKNLLGGETLDDLVPHWLTTLWALLWHLIAGYLLHKGWNNVVVALLPDLPTLSLFETTILWVCLYY
jgi:hypothetical protein